jgi:hypothetical protein
MRPSVVDDLRASLDASMIIRAYADPKDID